MGIAVIVVGESVRRTLLESLWVTFPILQVVQAGADRWLDEVPGLAAVHDGVTRGR